MRKLTLFFLVIAVVLMIASPVYAQTGASASSNWGVPIGVGLGMGLAAGLAGLGQGKVAGSVAEALARNPGARPGIQLALFIGLAFIESLVLFTFVLLFLRTQ
jgi:F-type H+-transporting ATPase subunit c